MSKADAPAGSTRPARRRIRVDGDFLPQSASDIGEIALANGDTDGAPTVAEARAIDAGDPILAGRAMEEDQVEAVIEAQHKAEAQARFRIFIVDSGWNSPARRVLHDNLTLVRDLTRDDPTYVLDEAMSVALLRQHKHLIGRDPIIVVHDVHALNRRGSDKVHGFRLHLGGLTSEDAVLVALQQFARFLANHRLTRNLERSVRKELRSEGLSGAIEIIVGATAQSELARG